MVENVIVSGHGQENYGVDLEGLVGSLWRLAEEARWGDETWVRGRNGGKDNLVFSPLMGWRVSRNRHALPTPLSSDEERFTINLTVTPASVRGMEYLDGYLLELQDVSNLLGFTEFALACNDGVKLIFEEGGLFEDGSLKLERICDHPSGHKHEEEEILGRVMAKISRAQTNP